MEKVIAQLLDYSPSSEFQICSDRLVIFLVIYLTFVANLYLNYFFTVGIFFFGIDFHKTLF